MPPKEDSNNQPTQTPTQPQTPQSTNPAQATGGPVKQSLFSKKNLPKIIIAAVVLLIGAVAAAYFLYVAPNKPANLWKKSLANTAAGYDRLVNYIDTQKETKGSKTKGDFKVEGATAGDGSFEVEAYEKNAKLKFDLGFGGQRVNAEVVSILPENSQTPDIYLNFKGVKGLGALLGSGAEISSAVDQLDGRWIFIDHTFLDGITQRTEQSSQVTFTQSDMVAVLKAIGEANRDYLFSDAQDKRVLKINKEVGRETRDGRSVYHFKAGIDKQHLKDYLTSLKQNLENTKAKDAFGSSLNAYLESLLKDIDENKDIEEMEIDVWVDTKTKLIRFLRFPDKDKADNYFEIGFLLDDNTKYPFSFSSVLDKAKSNITITVDTQANKVLGDFSFDSGEESGFKLSGTFESQSSDQEITITKPDNALTIVELMNVINELSGGTLGASTGRSPLLPSGQ